MEQKNPNASCGNRTNVVPTPTASLVPSHHRGAAVTTYFKQHVAAVIAPAVRVAFSKMSAHGEMIHWSK